jgi:hypothetical protein
MTLKVETVVVKYKTEKHLCSCCWQKLPEPKVSKEMEFIISKVGVMQYAEWVDIAEYPEDMDSIVPEYVHETIAFHATFSEERILVDDSEIEKVKEFILRVIVGESIEVSE